MKFPFSQNIFLGGLSTHPSCLQSDPGYTEVCLRPNPAFVPAGAWWCLMVELAAFYPPPIATVEDQRLNCLCPVRDFRRRGEWRL